MLSQISVSVRVSQQSLRMYSARFLFRKGAGRNLRGLLVLHLGQRAGHHPGYRPPSVLVSVCTAQTRLSTDQGMLV